MVSGERKEDGGRGQEEGGKVRFSIQKSVGNPRVFASQAGQGSKSDFRLFFWIA